MLNIKFTGIDATRGLVTALRGFPEQVIDDMAAIAFATMRAGAGRHSPRPRGTGRLFASLFRSGAGTTKQVVGHDLQSAPHAQYVVFPTRPHEIRPKKPGGWLAWRSNGGGGPWVFRRRVWHPGYAGDNYRDEAIDETTRRFREVVDAAFRRL